MDQLMERFIIAAESIGIVVKDGLRGRMVFTTTRGEYNFSEQHITVSDGVFCVEPYACGRLVLWKRNWNGKTWKEVLSPLEKLVGDDGNVRAIINGKQYSIGEIALDIVVPESIKSVELTFWIDLPEYKSDKDNIFRDFIKTGVTCYNLVEETREKYFA